MSTVAERLKLAVPVGRFRKDDGLDLIRDAISEIERLEEQLASMGQAVVAKERECLRIHEQSDNLINGLERKLAAMTKAKNKAVKALREMYEYYCGEHARGDYTCSCGWFDLCGPCEMRETKRKLIKELEKVK